jgi:hypothetical protein
MSPTLQMPRHLPASVPRHLEQLRVDYAHQRHVQRALTFRWRAERQAADPHKRTLPAPGSFGCAGSTISSLRATLIVRRLSLKIPFHQQLADLRVQLLKLPFPLCGDRFCLALKNFGHSLDACRFHTLISV